MLKHFMINFFKCGTVGWCLEIIFTSMHALKTHDYKLIGNTSIWMFPIYGCAAFLSVLYRLIKKYPFWVRGLTYMFCIFSVEYASGSLLKRFNICPWNYKNCRLNVNELIRLDYAPYWFGAGLLYEHILSKRDS